MNKQEIKHSFEQASRKIAGVIDRGGDLLDIQRVIRDIFVEEFGFDRAGVFSYDAVTETICGSWGTDPFGNLEDTSSVRYSFRGIERTLWETMKKGGPPYIVRHYEPDDVRLDLPEEMRSVRDHASIILSAAGELVGFIAVDNLLTHRPLNGEMIERFLPFAKQAAMAMQNAKLRDDREANRRKLQRLVEISLAITSNDDLDTVFRLVRDSIMEIGYVDRASVWILKDGVYHGTWGTDELGNVLDEHHKKIKTALPHDFSKTDSAAPFVIDTISFRGRDGQQYVNVPHAFIPIKIGEEMIGFVAVDKLLTFQPITPAMIQSVLPITDQTAVAVQKARLLERQETIVKQQKRVMEIAGAIAEHSDPDEIFKLVRDSVLELGCVDRVGVWVVNDMEAHGRWGTDENGDPVDEHFEHRSLERFSMLHPEFMRGEGEVIRIHQDLTTSNGETRANVPSGAIALRAKSELVGLISIDNLITGRPISDDVLDLIRPLARQAAIAALNINLQSEREAVIQNQQRLFEIGVAITADEETDTIFRMVRDAVLELGAVDRVGVWLVDGNVARGTWGTDVNGELLDEHGMEFPIDSLLSQFESGAEGYPPFIIESVDANLRPDERMESAIPHAVIPLRAGNDLIGLLAMDTYQSHREITPEKLEIILPLANLAAVVVLKRRMFEAVHQELDRRRELEGVLRGQTEELIVARDEAQAGNRAKSEFLANMSHEIRTPINGVVGMTSILLSTPLSDEQRAYIGQLQKCTDSLMSMIDDILDFSKLDADKLPIERQPFSLKQCVESIGLTIGARIRKGVSLHTSIDPEIPENVVGDERRTRQMLKNVMLNAAQFTDEGEVSLAVSLIGTTKDSVSIRFVISDTGIGIEESRQKAIFESFTQADGSSTRRHDGAGLGLTIAKGLAELMRGSISLVSKPNVGTTVTLEITLEKWIGDRQVAPPPFLPTGLRVLLAEDNPINSMMAYARLEEWGCHCVAVENGFEAVRAYQDRVFDLILMDISMPEMDGIEATREVRRLEFKTGGHIPIIALTAHAMEGDRERCLAAGMDDYVSKPVNFDLLHQVLRTHCARLL